VQRIPSRNIVQKSYDSIAIRHLLDSTVHGQSFPPPQKARRERWLDSPISLIVRDLVDAHTSGDSAHPTDADMQHAA
jgi:hypothetical protein